MIIILKKTAKQEEINELTKRLTDKGVIVSPVIGETMTILGLVGDTSKVSMDSIQQHHIVERVLKVQEPYKKANRKFHPDDTVVEIDGQRIGNGYFGVIAGPCSVEGEEQIINIAQRAKAAGANFLRGGAFKPRTSPYSFQGLELEGLRLLKLAKEATGLPIVTELMSTKFVDEFEADVDLIQIGARNMQNFDLLKEVGKTKTPVLLKRGLSATYEEWLMSAEYIMSEGNENVILCERGIRTYETETRNTLDIQAVPVIQKLSHLPIIIDPSHAGGSSYLVPSMSKAAVMSGANGLMVEIHHDPENAWSDGQQCLNPNEFDELMAVVKQLIAIEGKHLDAVK
ncbi:3-deoxy-7-phosphoheptulonate synthase [Trichococcus ilyis]|jgi:3-deoxy-7-phosphoheptulonate synthase|uniref:3-deoxy-D-arabinoheptulosonate-7-phosphate synthase n=1 Tax=Trichococcus ilyis TaxID=640938 RepID=A0A143YXI7_9LACT|nr:3-deoxy-7-phosphoheptulonate synthase [Trichococcus ilyis]CZR01030.1 dahp synthetase i/kdsa [Trichococcus ilyis]SEJ36165.1 3-deoxy-D-arabinoheptulosonate-7-phosphate synthase [Trichococcus ilyis]